MIIYHCYIDRLLYITTILENDLPNETANFKQYNVE